MKTVFDDLFPEPLYETYITKKKICLVCGSAKAVSVLRTPSTEIFPLCEGCSTRWNFYGYEIFKKVKPKQLLWNLVKFKLLHPFYDGYVSIYKNLKIIEAWSTKMKRWAKSRKEESA